MVITLRSEKPVTPAAEPVDEFRYGWRYLHKERPDGSVEYEQVPLTLEDVLYPQVGDFIMHTTDHDLSCGYLKDVIRSWVDADPTALVMGDTRIAWDRGGVKPMGPDVAVIFGVKEKKNWATFDTAGEGARPCLVMEVTSPDTGRLDVEDKLELYARAEIPWYVVVDYDTRRGRPRYARGWIEPPRSLHGHRLVRGRYEEVPANERGWIWIEPVNLWIGLEDGLARLYDEAGQPLADYSQVRQAGIQAEREKAEAEREKADAETARTRAERGQAEAETARTQAERGQAEAEAALRNEAAARVEAEKRAAILEARLRELEAISPST